MGFHSNDARGVTAPVDPADPLVRTYGAEIGVRSAYLQGLHSTIAFWWLDIDSELLFVGDAGTTEASRPSRRYGVEIANYYSPTEWLTLRRRLLALARPLSRQRSRRRSHPGLDRERGRGGRERARSARLRSASCGCATSARGR